MPCHLLLIPAIDSDFVSYHCLCQNGALHFLPLRSYTLSSLIRVVVNSSQHHEDQRSATAESMSLPQNPPSMLKEASELSRLEQLPPELRRSILVILDLNQLKTLIKASPTFHQQYRHDRRSILGSALHTTLDLLAVEAYAVHLTNSAEFGRHYPGNVFQFLKSYHRLRFSSNFSLLEQGLKENDLSDLAMFHLSVFRPFTEMYTNWALTNVAAEFKKPKRAAHTAPLSRTEEIRIMRALYRFQLWCNLFGSRKQYFDEVGTLDGFFGLYEPWEVDEIKSVHTFATDGFCLALYSDCYKRSPRIFAAADGFHVEFGFDDRKKPGRARYMKVECDFHGTAILPTASTQLTALYTHLFNTIKLGYYSKDLLDLVLDEDTQSCRRMDYPSTRDQRGRDQEPFPFKGDDPAQPPVAWTQMWQDEYSNFFGKYTPDKLSEWGFMMWDEARFRNLKGYEVVWYICRDEWGIYDPRERERILEEENQEESEDD